MSYPPDVQRRFFLAERREMSQLINVHTFDHTGFTAEWCSTSMTLRSCTASLRDHEDVMDLKQVASIQFYK